MLCSMLLQTSKATSLSASVLVDLDLLLRDLVAGGREFTSNGDFNFTEELSMFSQVFSD